MEPSLSRIRSHTHDGILLLFLIIASVMFIGSYRFSEEVARFPRLNSGFVIIGTLVLLFRTHLPEWTRKFTSSSSEIFEESIDEIRDQDDQLDEDTTEEENSKKNSAVTGAFITAYTVLGLAVGLLWVTPFFVAVYLKWAGKPRRTIIVLTILSAIIAVIFLLIFDVPIAEGFIFT